MLYGRKVGAMTITTAAISGAVIYSFIQFAVSLFSGNYPAAAAAFVAIVLAYAPQLKPLVDQINPYLPAWLAVLAGMLAKLPDLLVKLIPQPRPTPVDPVVPPVPPGPVDPKPPVPPTPPIVPPTPHA